MKRIIISSILAMTLSFSICQAQDFGRQDGFGVRIGGEQTYNQEGFAEERAKDGKTVYEFLPNKRFRSLKLEAFYRRFISRSSAFIEAQMAGYYMKDKSDTYEAMDISNLDKQFIFNSDFKEWGASAVIVGGYNFPIKSTFSIDAFTGPEVRCAFSCKNGDFNSRNLLGWHFNRWQMRWRLGAGFNYRHVGVQVYGSYDVTKKPKPTLHNDYEKFNPRSFTLSLALGYKF